jgi:hypothetical protein
VTEIVTLAGPLEPRKLSWISDLYGRVDPKYRRTDVLEHLFTATREPALHAFAVDGSRPVGHCCVVPTPGRVGPSPLRAGKLEALFIEESHRGRQSGQPPVVATLLTRLYAFADEQGLELVHALATPEIGRVIRFTALDGVGERSHVAAASAQGRPAKTLAATQRLLLELEAAGTGSRFELRTPTQEDVGLVEARTAAEGRWTVAPKDAWSWYVESPLLRVLEVAGRHGSRALVQLPGSPREPFRLVGWRPERPGLRSALALLRAAGRAARESGAATVRFQAWNSPAANGALKRACRVAGFVRRPDLTTVWVRTRRPELARADAVVSTPSLYLGF